MQTLTFLAWAFLLETFFGFEAVILLVVVFFEETLGVVAPLTATVSLVTVVFMVMVVSVVLMVFFAIMAFFGAAVFLIALALSLLSLLGLLAAPLEVAFPDFLVDGFFAIGWKLTDGQTRHQRTSFVVLGGPRID